MNHTIRKAGLSIAAVAAAGALLVGCSSSDTDDVKDAASSVAATATSVAAEATSKVEDAADDVDEAVKGIEQETLTNSDGEEIEVSKAIADKYRQLGAGHGHLGEPVGEQHDGHGGAYLEFTGGIITWSPETDAHFFSGEIAEAFTDNGGVEKLGFATDDMTSEGGVKEAHFQHATITFADGATVVTEN